MRSLVLVLALAISHVALTVCQLTCSAHVAGHQHDAAVPSCHESSQMYDGPALRAPNLCQHSEGELLLAKAPPAFQLLVAQVPSTDSVVLIERPTNTLGTTGISSGSPPPLLLPLRI